MRPWKSVSAAGRVGPPGGSRQRPVGRAPVGRSALQRSGIMFEGILARSSLVPCHVWRTVWSARRTRAQHVQLRDPLQSTILCRRQHSVEQDGAASGMQPWELHQIGIRRGVVWNLLGLDCDDTFHRHFSLHHSLRSRLLGRRAGATGRGSRRDLGGPGDRAPLAGGGPETPSLPGSSGSMLDAIKEWGLQGDRRGRLHRCLPADARSLC